MRKFVLGAVITVLTFAVAEPAAAQAAGAQPADQPDQTVTLTASVVDLSCKYVQNASGPDHRMCAQVCADKGQPLGLLTPDGQFYLPINNGMGADGENARLKEFAEQDVKVTGKVIDRGGVKAIVIESVAKA